MATKSLTKLLLTKGRRSTTTFGGQTYYHKSGYNIDYDLLSGKNAAVATATSGTSAATAASAYSSTTPDTVKRNVKNVQGWRGGAERGFLAAYPDLVQVMASDVPASNQPIRSWFTKVFTANLSSGFLGQDRYGLIVPMTYRQLMPNATKEQMLSAHRLGWAVELARATNALTEDLIYATGKNPLPEKYNLGPRAFNDVFFLQDGIISILRHYFKEDTVLYSFLLETFLDAQRSSAIGRLLCFDPHPSKKPGMEGYTMELYKNMIKFNVSNLNYCLPVSLALHLAGLNEPKMHDHAKGILQEIGYFAELNRDFHNCYLDPQGRDIENGHVTWLIVLAHQRGTPAQKKVLEARYGVDNSEDALEVKRIYRELKLKKTLLTHIDEKKNEILERIQQISRIDDAGLSQEFYFELLEKLSINLS